MSAQESVSTHKLLVRIARRDLDSSTAWAEFDARWRRWATVLVRVRYPRIWPDVEDLVQDVLLRMWQHSSRLAQLTEDRCADGLLATMVHQRCIDRCRSISRRTELLAARAEWVEPEPEPDALHGLMIQERVTELRSLAERASAHRAWRARLEDPDEAFPDIAQQCGMNCNTAKTHVRRARLAAVRLARQEGIRVHA